MSDAEWSLEALDYIDKSTELEIATERRDGTFRAWTPIWVVCAGGSVYVRTWYRRGTGWFGDAVRAGRARIRVPGLEAEVSIGDVGVGSAALRDAIDEAYREKYGSAGRSSMVGPTASATTLVLKPVI